MEVSMKPDATIKENLLSKRRNLSANEENSQNSKGKEGEQTFAAYKDHAEALKARNPSDATMNTHYHKFLHPNMIENQSAMG